MNRAYSITMTLPWIGIIAASSFVYGWEGFGISFIIWFLFAHKVDVKDHNDE